MQILLDESLPVRLANAVPAHGTTTVRRMGWSGIRNGELLRRAAAEGFEVFLMADRNLRYQHNVSQLGVAVVVLLAPTNSLKDLLPLIPSVLDALPTLKPEQVVEIGAKPRTGPT
jgi:predicted nuclease of predicted toxin-antitoxin system